MPSSLFLELARAASKTKPKAAPQQGGRWVTIEGHHILLSGKTKAENDAIIAGSLHGGTATKIWHKGDKNTPAGHQSVKTTGEAATDAHVDAYAAKFGISDKAADLIKGQLGKSSNVTDTKLSQVVADISYVHQMTGQSHEQIVKDLSAGKKATDIVAAHIAAQPAAASQGAMGAAFAASKIFGTPLSVAPPPQAAPKEKKVKVVPAAVVKPEKDWTNPDTWNEHIAQIGEGKGLSLSSKGALATALKDGTLAPSDVAAALTKAHDATFGGTILAPQMQQGIDEVNAGKVQGPSAPTVDPATWQSYMTQKGGILGDFASNTVGEYLKAGQISESDLPAVLDAIHEENQNWGPKGGGASAAYDAIVNFLSGKSKPQASTSVLTAEPSTWADYYAKSGKKVDFLSGAESAIQDALKSGQIAPADMPALLDKIHETAKAEQNPNDNEPVAFTPMTEDVIKDFVAAKNQGVPASGAPSITPSSAVTADPNSWVDYLHDKNNSNYLNKSGQAVLAGALQSKSIFPVEIPQILDAAAAKSGSGTILGMLEIEDAIKNHIGAPEPVAPVAPPAPQNHNVTLSGKNFALTQAPATSADIDHLAAQGVGITGNGKTAMQNAITSGQTPTHAKLLETAAIAQASSKAKNLSSINGPGFNAALSYGGIPDVLEKAHNGNADAQGIANNLGAHSFVSDTVEAAKAAKAAQAQKMQQAAQNAAVFAQHKTEFAGATPAEHLHNPISDPSIKKGYNDGALYQLPSGAKNYVKTPQSAAVAHNEHLANKIYQALGISAPDSKVFEQSGKTRYASHIIPNDGTLNSHGITPDISKELLKGFAADVLLGNRDVLGNGNNPLSNVVISTGPDGKPQVHRIDNGAALLHTGTGSDKAAEALNGLREYDGFATENGNYKQVFSAAGVKDAASVAGLGQQIKAITALRDAHNGWDGFIKSAAPDMPEAQRKQTAQVLEARTTQLQARAATIAGANSLVGTRTFHFDAGDASAHEKQIIDYHKQNAPKPTAAQVTAIDSFKGSGYIPINRGLLGKDALSPEYAKQVKELDNYYAQPGAVLGVDSALSRTIGLSPDERAKLLQLQPGDVIAKTPVYQSTSTKSGLSITGGNVHFMILAPKETPALPPQAHTSTNSGENEILLPRGLSYRVVAVLKPGDVNPSVVPQGWDWHSSAESSGVRMVLEAIVPGVNDIEHSGVNQHVISEAELKAGLKDKGKAKVLTAPDLSSIAQAKPKPAPA